MFPKEKIILGFSWNLLGKVGSWGSNVEPFEGNQFLGSNLEPFQENIGSWRSKINIPEKNVFLEVQISVSWPENVKIRRKLIRYIRGCFPSLVSLNMGVYGIGCNGIMKP